MEWASEPSRKINRPWPESVPPSEPSEPQSAVRVPDSAQSSPRPSRQLCRALRQTFKHPSDPSEKASPDCTPAIRHAGRTKIPRSVRSRPGRKSVSDVPGHRGRHSSQIYHSVNSQMLPGLVIAGFRAGRAPRPHGAAANSTTFPASLNPGSFAPSTCSPSARSFTRKTPLVLLVPVKIMRFVTRNNSSITVSSFSELQ